MRSNRLDTGRQRNLGIPNKKKEEEKERTETEQGKRNVMIRCYFPLCPRPPSRITVRLTDCIQNG